MKSTKNSKAAETVHGNGCTNGSANVCANGSTNVWANVWAQVSAVIGAVLLLAAASPARAARLPKRSSGKWPTMSSAR